MNESSGRREHAFHLDPGLTKVDDSAFVAPGVVLVGDVHVGSRATLWYGVIVRGDCEKIRIADDANVQDGTVIHADPGFPALIGEGATIGHRCVIHGATIGAGAMVGMGSVVMNGAVIGAGSIVGAGALVTQGKEFPPNSMILGSPARRARALTDEERHTTAFATEHYVAAGAAYRAAGLDRTGS